MTLQILRLLELSNKAKQVREALGLTPTEAGELFTGHDAKKAYDTWSRWERTGNWPAPADKLFIVILSLVMAKDLKTRGAAGALDLVLNILALDE